MDLSLGTAQWGAGYGLTNRKGRLSDDDVEAVVMEALAGGVRSADTHRPVDAAQGYGNAQERLRPWGSTFAITTKVFGGSDADLPIRAQLQDSLEQLGVSRVEGCLIHDWSTLDDKEAGDAARQLDELVADGLVERAGVSAYAATDIERALVLFPRLGAVQAPLNAVDQRLAGSSVLAGLRAAGTQLHVRSVFLQGLLADADADVPLSRHPHVVRFHEVCRERGVAPLLGALSYVRTRTWVDRVVVGVTSAGELSEILQAWRVEPESLDWPALASDDLDLVDPRRWAR